MRYVCLLFAGLLLLAATACQGVQRVRVCDPCGCRCVAAPVMCRVPCGTVLQGQASSGGAAATALDGKKLTVKWQDMRLDPAFEVVRQMTGVEIFVDSASWSRDYANARLTIELEDVSLRELLDLMTGPFDMTWSLEGERVVVKPKKLPGHA